MLTSVWLGSGLVFVPHTAQGQTLVAYYPFNGNFQDASGNGNHGTPNAVVFANDRNGIPNRASMFNGVNGHVDVGTGVKPAFPITFVSWVKGNGTVFSNDRVDSAGSRFGFSVYWTSTNAARQVAFYSGASGASTREHRGPAGLGDLDPDAWHHLAVVMHSVTNTEWFINGQVYDDEKVGDGTGTSMRYSSDGRGTIGATLPESSSSFYFSGAVDELRIYAGALSHDAVKRLPEYDQVPKIVKVPSSLNVASGSPARFTVEGSSPTPFQYQWYRLANNVEQPLPGETGDSLVIDPAIAFFQGQYLVKLSNDWGVVSSAPVRLHVSQIVPQVSGLLSLRFPTSHGKLYQVISTHSLSNDVWRVETEETAGIGRVLQTDLTPADPIQFFRIRESSDGSMPTDQDCVVSGGATIEILEPPLDQIVPDGGTAVFSVSVSGDEPVSFQWWGPAGSLSDDPMFFSGTRSCTLTMRNLFNLFSGDYWAVVTNPASTNVTELARLTVTPFRASHLVGARISFPAIVDRSYQIDYSPNLNESAWFQWGDPVVALEPEIILDFTNSSPNRIAFRATDVTP